MNLVRNNVSSFNDRITKVLQIVWHSNFFLHESCEVIEEIFVRIADFGFVCGFLDNTNA